MSVDGKAQLLEDKVLVGKLQTQTTVYTGQLLEDKVLVGVLEDTN